MALGAQLPVRLDPESEKRLERAAKLAGTTKSAIIRLLVDTFVRQVVAEDGQVTLPPNWAELLGERDARAGTRRVVSSEIALVAEDPGHYQVKKSKKRKAD